MACVFCVCDLRCVLRRSYKANDTKAKTNKNQKKTKTKQQPIFGDWHS